MGCTESTEPKSEKESDSHENDNHFDNENPPRPPPLVARRLYESQLQELLEHVLSYCSDESLLHARLAGRTFLKQAADAVLSHRILEETLPVALRTDCTILFPKSANEIHVLSDRTDFNHNDAEALFWYSLNSKWERFLEPYLQQMHDRRPNGNNESIIQNDNQDDNNVTRRVTREQFYQDLLECNQTERQEIDFVRDFGNETVSFFYRGFQHFQDSSNAHQNWGDMGSPTVRVLQKFAFAQHLCLKLEQQSETGDNDGSDNDKSNDNDDDHREEEEEKKNASFSAPSLSQDHFWCIHSVLRYDSHFPNHPPTSAMMYSHMIRPGRQPRNCNNNNNSRIENNNHSVPWLELCETILGASTIDNGGTLPAVTAV